jgi:hypothetical protein
MIISEILGRLPVSPLLSRSRVVAAVHLGTSMRHRDPRCKFLQIMFDIGTAARREFTSLQVTGETYYKYGSSFTNRFG